MTEQLGSLSSLCECKCITVGQSCKTVFKSFNIIDCECMFLAINFVCMFLLDSGIKLCAGIVLRIANRYE